MKDIYLELAKSNNAAVNLCLINYFIKIDVSEKIYSFGNHKIDAGLFKKIINA